MFLYRLIQKFKIIKRFNYILLVFFGAGFSVIIDKLGFGRNVRFHPLRKLGKPQSFAEEELPRKLREALESLGPVFVKFGQILSTRSDILPEAYTKELEKLQSAVKPFAYPEAEKLIEENLGKDINQVFKNFNKTPFASASLGQVYKAQLKTGEWVAIKVQRPKAKNQIKLDTAVLLMLANWMDKNVEEARGFNLIGLVQEFRRWTLNELDYRKEATNCEIFSNFFKDDQHIYGPKVYWEYTGESVLTLEYVDGTPLSKIVSSRKTKTADKKQLAHLIADSFIRQFFEYGFFHADPHPGNIFILKNNKVMFLDFGMVGFLDDRLAGLGSALFVALIQKDTETLVSLLMQIEEKYDDEANPRRPLNANGLRKDLNQLVLQWPDNGQGGKFTHLLSELLRSAVKNGINVPTDLAMLAKSIVTLDVVVKQLDADFQMDKWEQPMVEKILTKKLQGKNIKSAAKTSVFVLEDLLKKLPASTATVVENLEKGKFGMEINGSQLMEYEKLLNANSKLNSYGTLLATLVIASALTYGIKGQPQIWGATLAQLGLYGGLALIVLFLISNFKKGT